MTTCRTLVPLLVAGAFDGNSALAAGITVHDARDRDVRIENPGHIVAIGGAITENRAPSA